MLSSDLLHHGSGAYINGAWSNHTADCPKLSVRNPATGALLAELPCVGEAETIQAIAAAEAALQRDIDIKAGQQRCEALAQALIKAQDAIAHILCSEHGKPLAEAKTEVAYAASFFQDAARRAPELHAEVLPDTLRGCEWTIHKRPTGVVALITPWNFPIGMIAKKLAPALLTGCPCLVKPSSKTPLTMQALFHLLDELDLPPGLVNLLIGSASDICTSIVSHPVPRMISFTGSTKIGQELMQAAAPGIKRLALELGGNAPCIIFADADLEHTIQQLLANKFRGAGQTCVCTNRVYVAEAIAETFTEHLCKAVARLSVGNGMDAQVDVGPLIDRAGFNKVRAHVDQALDAGAQLRVGTQAEAPDADFGFFYPPTVLTGVQDDMLCCQDETFGPVLPILTFADEAEVLQRANATDFGLAAYVFTADAERAQRCISALLCGHVGWNTATGPAAEAPFGGCKLSGFGREGGSDALHDYIETQTVPCFRDN